MMEPASGFLANLWFAYSLLGHCQLQHTQSPTPLPRSPISASIHAMRHGFAYKPPPAYVADTGGQSLRGMLFVKFPVTLQETHSM
jgi:hypothetical protein